MVAAAQRILEEALRLPEADQLEIASRLLASATPDLNPVPDDEWVAELRRRKEEYLAHPETGISWEKLKAESQAPAVP